ncbi:hypothetical protein BST61_g5701 [Cercospora zeina]
MEHLLYLQDGTERDAISFMSRRDGVGTTAESDIDSALFKYFATAVGSALPQTLDCGFYDRLVRAFSSKPWLSRARVVQEAILAPKSRLIYGGFEYALDKVLLVAASIAIFRKHADLIGISSDTAVMLRRAGLMWYNAWDGKCRGADFRCPMKRCCNDKI